MAKPLRQFLQTIDDRKRAIENDLRAKETAPPAPGPDRHPERGRLHRHGGGLELLLLADAQHQHAGRQGAHPARVAHGGARTAWTSQRAAEDAGRPRALRALQLVPRPEPARHSQPRPARRRLEPDRGEPARRERAAGLAARRAARRGPARGGPAARPARRLEAADRAAARRPAPARLAQPAPAARARPRAPAIPRPATSSRSSGDRAPARPPPSTKQTTGQLLDYLLAP